MICLFLRFKKEKLQQNVIERNIPTKPEISQPTATIEEAATIASDGTAGPVVYRPTVDKILNCGSTSIIGRLKPGVVKSPRYS